LQHLFGEYGSATPSRNEKDGWIMSCSGLPAQSRLPVRLASQ
jgi:hypothetical protein